MTGEDIQKDMRAESIPDGSMTTTKSVTHKANTSQARLPYPVSYRPECLDRYTRYLVYMA